MPVIKLVTNMQAPLEVCFDLSRSIDLHLESTKQTRETVTSGRTSGLIGLNETVTWRARHLGIWQTLTSKITEMRYPDFFADEMVSGAFKSFRHEHYFVQVNAYTVMTDIFLFESPLWLLGKLANRLFLTKYLTNLLTYRNDVIKQYAELHLNPNKAL